MTRIGVGTAVVAAFAVALLSPGAWCEEVIGKATVDLDGRQARVAESSLGSVAADAARAAVGAQLAVLQASLLRPVVLPVDEQLTRENLTAALLYPDEKIVLVEVSGEQLEAALERSVSMLPKPSRGFLQVSGLRVTFRSDVKAGHRIARVMVGSAPLAPDKTYRAAMPASLAKGALGYYRIFNGLEPKRQGPDPDPELGQALCDYVRAHAAGPTDGRLLDLAKSGG
jgi:2',3'-cyclic-nucleotide 2'-phosphodiesterase (5'-nucleotidase family)